MPISCPGGEKPRYRVKTTSKTHDKIRLAFCGGGHVVEAKKLAKKAKAKKTIGNY